MPRPILSRRALIIGACIFLTSLVLTTIWSGSAKFQENSLEVKNETSSLQIVSVSKEVSGEDKLLVRLTVLNTSNQDLVAHTILKQDLTMLTTNGATTGWSVGPGQQDTIPLVIKDTDKTLTLSAALFRDGSSEGDLTLLQELKDYQDGVKAQFNRAIPIFRGRLNARSSAGGFNSLRTELLNLPERFEGQDRSISKSEGMADARQYILGRLSANSISHGDVTETLSKLEKANARLEH